MIFAQIKDGLIVNVIVLDDQSLLPLFSQDFDNIIPIDNKPGSPAIGWSYDPKQGFSPPGQPLEIMADPLKSEITQILIDMGVISPQQVASIPALDALAKEI